MFLVTHDSKSGCRRCLTSHSRQKVLIKYKQSCQQEEKTANKISNDSQL